MYAYYILYILCISIQYINILYIDVFTADMRTIFRTNVGKMNFMQFFMHSTTTMKVSN